LLLALKIILFNMGNTENKSEDIDNDKPKKDYEDFFALAGSWIDSRSADEIIEDIRNSRVNKTDLEEF